MQFIVGIFGKVGELQTILCTAYGSNGILYSGTLSGDIYKWQENKLVATIPNAHSVCNFFEFLSRGSYFEANAVYMLLVTEKN